MKLDMISQVRTAFTSLVSRSDEQSGVSAVNGTGRLRGATVQMASTATAPAHAGGIGERLKDFVNGAWQGIVTAAHAGFDRLVGMLTRATQAQAPAGGSASRQTDGNPAAARKPNPNLDPQIMGLKDSIAYKTFNHGAFKAAELSSEEKSASSYAFVKELASKASGDVSEDTLADLSNTFLRTDNTTSKVSARIALDSEQTKTITADIINLIGTNVVGISTSSYGSVTVSKEDNPTGEAMRAAAPKHPGIAAALNDGAHSVSSIAANTIRVLDDVLCAFVGKPGDKGSVQDAVHRLDQDLCDQLAILRKAIEDCNIGDKATERALIMQCGRDTLALRTQSPALTVASTAPDLSAEKKSSLREINKGFLSIFNGKGIGGKDTQPEVVTEGAHMKDRWNPAIADFIDKAAARGNPSVITNATVNGQALVAEYHAINEKIDARIAELAA